MTSVAEGSVEQQLHVQPDEYRHDRLAQRDLPAGWGQGAGALAAGKLVATAARARREPDVRFLLAVDLDPATAEADAAGLEHLASEKALAAFARFLKAQEDGNK